MTITRISWSDYQLLSQLVGVILTTSMPATAGTAIVSVGYNLTSPEWLIYLLAAVAC